MEQINKEHTVTDEEERDKLEKLAAKVGTLLTNVILTNWGCKIIVPPEQVKMDRDYYQGWFEWDRGSVKRFQVMVPPKVKEKFELHAPYKAISITSSLGDFVFGINPMIAWGLHLGPVLQPQPDAYTHALPQRCSLLLLASDGLWAVTNNDEVQKLIEHIVTQHAPDGLTFDDLEGDEIVDILDKVLKVTCSC